MWTPIKKVAANPTGDVLFGTGVVIYLDFVSLSNSLSFRNQNCKSIHQRAIRLWAKNASDDVTLLMKLVSKCAKTMSSTLKMKTTLSRFPPVTFISFDLRFDFRNRRLPLKSQLRHLALCSTFIHSVDAFVLRPEERQKKSILEWEEGRHFR